MLITREALKEAEACTEGYDFFCDHFPAGEADYQAVLDKLAEYKHYEWAEWLMQYVPYEPEEGAEATDLGRVAAYNLYVAGNAVAHNIVVYSNLLVIGDLYVDGPLTVLGCVKVTGVLTLRDGCQVVGDLDANSIYAEDIVRVGGDLFSSNDVVVTAPLRVEGCADVYGSLRAHNTVCGNWLSVRGEAWVWYDLNVLGGSDIQGDLHVGKSVVVGEMLLVGGDVHSNGDYSWTVGASISAKDLKDFGFMSAKTKPKLFQGVFKGRVCTD